MDHMPGIRPVAASIVMRAARRDPEIALELGDPPGFDGASCVDCGNRFRLERDHVEPHRARGPTSKPNLRWRCDPCHQAKTARDRKAGKLAPPEP